MPSMKNISVLCCLGLLLFVSLVFAQSPDIPKAVVKSMKEVKPKSIKAHIQYLADDRLQGRMPGTEGYQMAVDYIVSQFKNMGVEPAGENGTYLQRVRLRRSVPDKDIVFTLLDQPEGTPSLNYGKEFT